jgi:hypothetical protein
MLIVFHVNHDQKAFYEGALTTTSYVGAFVGAVISTFLVKKSLRTLIIFIDCLFILGGFM